jgi:lambda family phage minor tail protein L
MPGDTIISPLETGVSTYNLQEQLHDLQATTILELFEVNAKKYGAGTYRFHPGKVLNGDVYHDGETYKPIPLEMDGVEVKGDGTLPRPKLRIANVDGFVSEIIQGRDDFVGLQVTRRRIFLKYLDAQNFHNNENPFGDPDVNSRFPDDKFIINQKTAEDKNTIEFELVSPLEMDTVKLPSRHVISNYCNWVYRGHGCGYGNTYLHPAEVFNEDPGAAIGVPRADEKDRRFVKGSGSYWLDQTNTQTIEGEDKKILNTNIAWNALDKKGETNKDPFHYSGLYNPTGIYLSGDYVYIPGAESSYYEGFSSDPNIIAYFVAKPTGQTVTEIDGEAFPHYNISGSDPRSDFSNWAKDQCSKTIAGCALRFSGCTVGMPFGGFPGTDKFGYV